MAPVHSKVLGPDSAVVSPIGSRRSRNSSTPDGEVCADLFAQAIIGLGPEELRVIHLAMSRAVALETADRGAEADALLLRLLRIVDDDELPGAAGRVRSRPYA